MNSIQYICEEPVHFGNNWEDPKLEEALINKYFLNSNESKVELENINTNESKKKEKINIVQICGGGDTVLHLLSHNYKQINNLQIVDTNEFQLYKLTDKAFNIINTNFLINYNGRYELLFQNVRNCFTSEFKKFISKIFSCKTMDEQLNLLDSWSQWYKELLYVFEKSMSQSILEQVFGNKACANRKQDFSQHFTERINNYLHQYLAYKSDYLSSILLGTDIKNPINSGFQYPLDLYATLQEIANFFKYRISAKQLIDKQYKDSNNTPVVKLFHGSMQNFLAVTVHKQHFINLSNITDWLDPDEVLYLLQLCYKTLHSNGIVLVRQLNSTIDIPKCAKKAQFTCESISSILPDFNESSAIYTNIYVLFKRKIADENNNNKNNNTNIDLISNNNNINNHVNIDLANKNNIDKFYHNQFIEDNLQNILKSKFFGHINSHINNYLKHCLMLEAFYKSQLQFQYAVDYFSKPFMVLSSRITNVKVQHILLSNIIEEHGGFNLKYESSHSYTFQQFINTLKTYADMMKNDMNMMKNKANSKIEIKKVIEEERKHEQQAFVLTFNSSLMGICTYEQPSLALSCLGMVEYAFANISSIIAKNLINSKYFKDDQHLHHYSLHANLDLHHANDLFYAASLLENSTVDNFYNNKSIQQGIKLASHIFYQLYNEMYLQYLSKAKFKIDQEIHEYCRSLQHEFPTDIDCEDVQFISNE